VESTGQFAKMIEAGLYPEEELSRLPDGILEKYFEPNGKPGYHRVIEKIRRQGYAVDDEEAVQGARCVSAPILNSDREPVAAVSVSGPVTRVSPNQVAVLAGAVTGAARAISAAMGFSQADPGSANRRSPKKVIPARN